MEKQKTKSKKTSKISSVLAREDSGNVQITFTIPFELVEKAQKEALLEIAKDVEVPGFRRGKAPLDKVVAKVPEQTLIEKSLSKLLPEASAEVINKNKIKPAIYPKFELIKAVQGESWEIKATTCEIPEVNLGNYKKMVAGAFRASSIWTPDKKGKEAQKPSKEESEQLVIKAVLDNVKIDIPELLIKEEANAKLSQLLTKIEKLGMNLDGYLSSLGKNAEELRTDYENQARELLKLELILNQVAIEENIKIKDDQIEDIIKASAPDAEAAKQPVNPEQKRLIESALKRRAALDSLVSHATSS